MTKRTVRWTSPKVMALSREKMVPTFLSAMTLPFHIAPEERGKIFEEEYRESNALNKPGTEHGLTFIKNSIKMHGGVVGHEATQYGNNFYFIIPRSN